MGVGESKQLFQKMERFAVAINISRRTVTKLMKGEELMALQPKSFIPKTTDSKHGKRVAENLLLNKLKPNAPDQIWTVCRNSVE